MKRIFALLAIAMLLAGCASKGQHAPVIERGTTTSAGKNTSTVKKRPVEKDWRPEVYVVQKGDTLYSIAFNYGFDYHELAEMNGIQDPNFIQIGQKINLLPGRDSKREIASAPVAQVRPVVKDQPKVTKQPYSESAVAQVEGGQVKRERPVAPVLAKVETKPDVVPEAKSESKPETDTGDDDALEWSMPAQGKLIGGFSSTDNRKGIEIAGKLGQPIYASAPGKVVYSGNGLRGYGKLLIVKHNKTYLSAYAHNDQLLVKEGETVTRGQKIAEMGNTDSDQVKLHFEVRRFGKPVDPANYLPLDKS